jgi:hypothetical protein
MLVGNLTEDGYEKGAVESIFVVRKFPRVTQCRDHVRETLPLCSTQAVVEHSLLDVEDLERSSRKKPACHVDRVVAGTRSDLEQPFPRRGGQNGLQSRRSDYRAMERQEDASTVGTGRGVLTPVESGPSEARKAESTQCRSKSHSHHPYLANRRGSVYRTRQNFGPGSIEKVEEPVQGLKVGLEGPRLPLRPKGPLVLLQQGRSFMPSSGSDALTGGQTPGGRVTEVPGPTLRR